MLPAASVGFPPANQTHSGLAEWQLWILHTGEFECEMVVCLHMSAPVIYQPVRGTLEFSPKLSNPSEDKQIKIMDVSVREAVLEMLIG